MVDSTEVRYLGGEFGAFPKGSRGKTLQRMPNDEVKIEKSKLKLKVKSEPRHAKPSDGRL